MPSTTDICLFDGFAADKLYELIYPAKNPLVMGLGYAVTRDIASFLRNRTHDDVGNPNPLAQLRHHRHGRDRGHHGSDTGIDRVYGFGSSSDGRCTCATSSIWASTRTSAAGRCSTR